ncbi:MAG TPA: hypothetical protein VMF13_23520 [Luteitalea sp.]|nr:hypothetical protein [Luteitalea sp.]
MADESETTETSWASKVFLGLAGIILLGAAIYGLYQFAYYLEDAKGNNEGAQALTFLILVGLALIVALMAGLGIVYSFLGVADRRQALALPEGSVRALIAFSLVLIFVCMATFVYKGAAATRLVEVGQLKRVTAQQITTLEKSFSVAAEPARDDKGTLITDPPQGGGQPVPLFNAVYYAEQGREANEIGKQIFTTLATVFVSVVSFYFGSSTTASAVGAGMNALKGDTPPPNVNTNKTPDGNKPPDPNKPTHQGPAEGPAI